MSTALKAPAMLRANIHSRPSAVDREAQIVRGFIVAEMGPFRSEGRGEFDSESMSAIVRLMQKEPNGLRSRFSHPIHSDGIGKLLGRVKSPRLDTVTRKDENGKPVKRQAVRADLHLVPSSRKTPHGDLGGYVMDLAEESADDPARDLLGASMVLKADMEWRRDGKTGRVQTDARGEALPPLWRPTEIHAVDLVDTGDAIRAFLSGDLDSVLNLSFVDTDEDDDEDDDDTPSLIIDEVFNKLAFKVRYGITTLEKLKSQMHEDDVRRVSELVAAENREVALHRIRMAQATPVSLIRRRLA